MSNQKLLLAGLEGPGISLTVRSLAQYMASNGVLATPHVGRIRGYVPLSAATYGLKVDKMSEQGRAFYNTRVGSGHLSIIPPEDEAELAKLEKRLRRAVEVRTLYDEFMPISAYESLKAEFDTIRAEYFAKRDEIVSKWDALVKEFEVGVAIMLADIKMPQAMRKQLLGEYLAQVPSVDKYRNSFSMTLRVHAFPAEVGALTGLNSSVTADVTQTWKDETVQTAILAIERQVGIGWSKMMGAMKAYLKSGTISGAAISGLTKFADELDWKNVFQNELLSNMAGTLKTLASAATVDDKASVIEDAITECYGYANKAGLDLSLCNCPYTQQQLDDMLFVYQSQVKQAM